VIGAVDLVHHPQHSIAAIIGGGASNGSLPVFLRRICEAVVNGVSPGLLGLTVPYVIRSVEFASARARVRAAGARDRASRRTPW
jgi:hypothetical protein